MSEQKAKRKIQSALNRVLDHELYVTEFRDEYFKRKASIYYSPVTNLYSIKLTKYVACRNKYEEKSREIGLCLEQVTEKALEFTK